MRTEKNHGFMEEHINAYMLQTNDFSSDYFSLATLLNNFVTFVLKKKERSSLVDDKLGEIKEGMTLIEFINNQVDKEFYLRTVQKIHEKLPIRGIQEEKYREEEEKKHMHVDLPRNADRPIIIKPANDDEDEQVNADEQELKKIYGEKVIQILWMFENDEVAKENLENPADVPAVDYGDEYGDEYGQEGVAAPQQQENSMYKVVNGIGY